MPDPSKYDNEDDWMGACVPAAIDEGREQDQAVAICMQMWKDRDKAAAPAEARITSILSERAWSTLTIKSIDSERREIEGMASTPEVDRIGDVVEPMGAKFSLPFPLLYQHDHKAPVGHVVSANATKAGISIRAQFAKVLEPGPLKDRIDTAWQEVKAGLVRGLSIGFRPKEYEPLDPAEPFGGLRFTAYDLFELSLVTIPANASATIAVVKSADSAALGHSKPANRPGATGKPGSNPVTLKERKVTMSKTISEQLDALNAAHAAKSARMESIMEKSMEEGRSTDDAEREEFDGLAAEVDQIDADIKRYSQLEKLNRQKAVPVQATEVKTVEDGAQARGGYVTVRQPDLPPGVRFARVVKAIGMARGNLVAACQIAEKQWGDDQPIVNILKAAVSAGTTMDTVWAGPLVTAESAVFADFLAYLRPMTILGKFGAGNIPSLRQIPFRVPVGKQLTGGAGYWVGEGLAKPLTSFQFGTVSLAPLKVANICVVTEELLRYAALPAETLLRDQLAQALAARIDTDFIDPAKTAVTNISPASITNGVSTVNSSGVDADAVRADVLALVNKFIVANNPASSAVWVMSASTAMSLSMMYNTLGQQEFNGISTNGGTFAGFPVIVSEFVGTSGGSPNTRYVWLVNAGDVFFADEGGISVDLSREASLVMDTAPTMASAELGSPSAPITGSMVSMFQTNSVAFRAERTLNWAKARTEAVQGLAGVVWGT